MLMLPDVASVAPDAAGIATAGFLSKWDLLALSRSLCYTLNSMEYEITPFLLLLGLLLVFGPLFLLL